MPTLPGAVTPDPETPQADVPAPAAAASEAPASAAVPVTSRRRPPTRLSREVLEAGRKAGAREGMDWLGREPEAHATLFYRLFAIFVRSLLYGAFRFRVRVEGRERLPRNGGYLLIAAAHRGWMDPFVAIEAIGTTPRAWFLGSAPSTFTAKWKEQLIHRVGGLLPVWRGGYGVDAHVSSALAVLRNGGVFVQMPEGTVSGPPGRIGPFRHGASLIALRTGAPVALLAMGGTEELYLGRRLAARVLPMTSAAALLAGEWDGTLPDAGSHEELVLARRLTERMEQSLGPEVEAIHPWTQDPPGHPRRLRRRLTWLLLRPGRLDRD